MMKPGNFHALNLFEKIVILCFDMQLKRFTCDNLASPRTPDATSTFRLALKADPLYHVDSSTMSTSVLDGSGYWKSVAKHNQTKFTNI
jgi:hypothetical protein